MYCTGFNTTSLDKKCGTCMHYTPLIKKDLRTGFEVTYCRGNCDIAKICSYRQRTDTCNNFRRIDDV